VRSSLLGTTDTGGVTFNAEDSFQAVLPALQRAVPRHAGHQPLCDRAKGRRAPVVQLDAITVAGRAVPRVQPVAAETVWNYEGGVKGSIGPFTGPRPSTSGI
jgi:hypothetical protein